MNGVSFLRFSQDPRKGTAHSNRARNATDDGDEVQETVGEGPDAIAASEPLSVPDGTTQDWLERLSMVKR